MAEDSKPGPILNEKLVQELREMAETLGRLSTTLASLPLAFLPRAQRDKVKQLADEAARMGAMVPRTVGALLDEAGPNAEETQGREDLGSRLRREQPHAGDPDEEGDEALPGEEEATKEIEEDIQQGWDSPPEAGRSEVF